MTAVQLELVPGRGPDYGHPLLAMRYGIEPRPTPRPRALRRGQHVVIDNPDWYTKWKADAATVMRSTAPRSPLLGALRVDVTAVFARGLSRPTATHDSAAVPLAWGPSRCWHLGTEDIDNIAKAVLDAAVQGGVIADDRFVVELRARKLWGAVGEGSCVELRVYLGVEFP